MIITKAYIDQLPEQDSNIYKVRVPLMEDNTGNIAIYDALSSQTPGIYKEYSVDDCVFVSFEDDQMVTAIILGKLDLNEIPESNTVYSIVNNLTVTNYATLPESTRIGDYTLGDIIKNINSAGSMASNSNTSLIYKEMRQW